MDIMSFPTILPFFAVASRAVITLELVFCQAGTIVPQEIPQSLDHKVNEVKPRECPVLFNANELNRLRRDFNHRKQPVLPQRT